MKRDIPLNTRETALHYQALMKPYSDKAEKRAREIISILEVKIKSISELIPADNIKNKIKRFYYQIFEEIYT